MKNKSLFVIPVAFLLVIIVIVAVQVKSSRNDNFENSTVSSSVSQSIDDIENNSFAVGDITVSFGNGNYIMSYNNCYFSGEYAIEKTDEGTYIKCYYDEHNMLNNNKEYYLTSEGDNCFTFKYNDKNIFLQNDLTAKDFENFYF